MARGTRVPGVGTGGKVFEALRVPQFRILLTSTLFAQMGLWTQQIALSWLVFDLTDSPLQLGLVAVCSGGTMTVCAPFSGALADRLDRRKVLIVSQFLLASLAVAIATLVATDIVQVWHLYVTAALTGVCFSANGPSRYTLAFDMVTERELASAISLNSIAQNLMRVAGPAVSGILIGSIGVEGAYVVQAVASVASMLMLSRIRPVTTRRPLVRANIFTSILQGLAYVRRDQPLLLLLTHSVIASICVLGFLSLMPAYADNALDFGPGGFGLLMSLMGVGGLLGSVFVAGLGYPVGKGKWLVMAAVVAGAMLLGMGRVPTAAFAIPAMFVLGATQTVLFVEGNAMIQVYADDRYRGRAISLFFMTHGMVPIGALWAGGAAEIIGVEAVFLLLGALGVGLNALLVIVAPRLWRL